MTDTDAQTNEFTGTQLREDVAKAIMSSMTSTLFDPDGAGRQIKIIVYDQKGFGRDIEIAADRCNRSAAFIHEAGGSQKPYSLLTHAGIGQVTKKPRLGAPG